MQLADSRRKYGSLSIAMHWLMVVLLVAVYAVVNLRESTPRGDPLRGELMTWHYMLGLSVLVLVLARVAIRLAGPGAPPILPEIQRWQALLSRITHFALYAFMVAMPLLGWLVIGAEGKDIPFFGLQLPALTGIDRAFAHSVEDIHKTIGTIGYYLAGLHAAAALFHHYIVRDNTLVRILPGRSPRP
jgi:cytochrome b561